MYRAAEIVMNDGRKNSHADCPAKGQYANYFETGRNKDELIILCGQRYVGDNEPPRMHTRIIMSPAYGKELLETLRKTLEEFDKNHSRNRK